MQQDTKIRQYLKIICEQIRWKKAHPLVSKEIEDHIMDQKNALIDKGVDEETAADQAIKEMGDPILIGSAFDRTYRPKIAWSIIVLTGVALLLGLAIRMFISYEANMPQMLMRSIMGTFLGIGCMTLAYFLDFTALGRFPKTIYFGLIAVTIGAMMVSPVLHGQYFYAQFLLLLFPTAFAGIIYHMRTKGYMGIILSGIFFAIPVVIGLMIPSFSGLILYAITSLVLLTVAIEKGWFDVKKLYAMLLVYIPTLITSVIAIFTFLSSPYRLARVKSAFDPSLDPMGVGYISMITRDMIANAKIFGQGESGVTAGIPVSIVHTDFLLTYLIHRLGWISFVVVMAVIVALMFRSFMLCAKQKSVLGKLVSFSVLTTFTIQVVIYVASNLGFHIFSPLTLPLISYGQIATIINMILIGLMLSVFKSGHLVWDNASTSVSNKNKFIEIVDGKVIIDFNPKYK